MRNLILSLFVFLLSPTMAMACIDPTNCPPPRTPNIPPAFLGDAVGITELEDGQFRYWVKADPGTIWGARSPIMIILPIERIFPCKKGSAKQTCSERVAVLNAKSTDEVRIYHMAPDGTPSEYTGIHQLNGPTLVAE